MQSRQSLSDGRAVAGTRPPDPQSIEKSDDRSGSPGDFAEYSTLPIFHRLRAGDAARRKMLHQPKKKRQVIFRNALFIERKNEIAGPGMHQEIGILDALSDALVGEQVAECHKPKESG